MNRRILAICLAIVSASLALSLPATADIGHPQVARAVRVTAATPAGPCYLPPLAGESIRHRMKRIIVCAVRLWSVPGGAKKAICVANRESNLNPKASSATGKYLGLFQHLASAWPSRFAKYTRPRWKLPNNALNGRSNTVVTIRMVHAAGWGPWKGAGC